MGLDASFEAITVFKVISFTHTKITELIPELFWFGNSSTQITEDNSQYHSVRVSVVVCSHVLQRSSNSGNNLVR